MTIDPIAALLSHGRDRPDHPAVVDPERTTTYGEFAALAGSVADALGERPRVLVHLAPGAGAFAAMFATLMAGGTYAPVNVGAPPEKKRMILERFAPDVVVGAGLADDFLDPWSTPKRGRSFSPRGAARKSAYVIFTSGSTGVPKGVEISYPALAHYVDWALEAMAVTSEDRWSQHPNIGFDLSVLDIFGALSGGATLVTLTEAERRLTPARAIRRHGLTIWNAVPSTIGLMMKARQLTAENLASLRLATFCGEPLAPESLDSLFAARPDLVVHNTYGPTEATVSCSLRRLTADDRRAARGPSVAVGDPIDGMRFELHGGDGPDEGELVIFGPQLAEGYWDDPETTARCFRDFGGERGYRTGDWMERRDGELFFRARIDRQVKIDGHRLELDEVAAALRRCGLGDAHCLVENGRLCAFVEGAPVDLPRLRSDLSTFIDDHAVPAEIHFVPSLPRNENGKVDEKALRKMTES